MRTKKIATYDVLVVLDGFSARLDGLRRLAATLDSECDAQNLLNVDIHYRTVSDSAVAVLHLDMRCVTGPLLRAIDESCQGFSCKTVRLNELRGEARTPYASHLSMFDVCLTKTRKCEDAINLLAENIGIESPEESSIATPPSLGVRFRRGGTWHQGRVCRATTSGLYVATPYLPRLGDIVPVELISSKQRFDLHASVVQLTQGESAEKVGSVGFGARYLISHTKYQELNRFMMAEKWQTKKFHQPPKRCEARYQLKWPVKMIVNGHTTYAIAEDISRNGLFVATQHPVVGKKQIKIVFQSDDGSGPISVHVKIVRKARPTTGGSRRKLGYGVEIALSPSKELRRYREFVERVSKRVNHYVIVGAAAARVDEIITDLVAAGYTAVGGDNPRALYHLADSSRPDALVIDASLKRKSPKGCRVLRNRLSRKIALVDACNTGAETRVFLDQLLAS